MRLLALHKVLKQRSFRNAQRSIHEHLTPFTREEAHLPPFQFEVGLSISFTRKPVSKDKKKKKKKKSG
jgi:hypothetical protein